MVIRFPFDVRSEYRVLTYIMETITLKPDDISGCADNPFICGVEAGCHDLEGGGYVCLCTDLSPIDSVLGCERNGEAANSTNSTLSPKAQSQFTTDDTFRSHQLIDMLSNSKVLPGNGSDLATSPLHNNTSFSFRTTINHPDVQIILIVSLFSVTTLVLLIVGSYCWRYRRYSPWFPKCLGGNPSYADYAGSLDKCRQQYLTNPNYYSSSPDTPSLQILRDMEIPRESVAFQEEIGEGCFGKVHKGTFTPTSGTPIPVAIKILKEGASTELQADFEREVEIISSFNHENILKFLGVVIKQDDRIPWMIFEYMRYGDLAELLRSNSNFLPRPIASLAYRLQQSDLLRIAIQVANGMVYLSSQHFIHRDLATRNCLVGDGLSVKISDFGMSRDIYTSDYYKISGSRMLPIRWMAPESIIYGKFSLESDVWAFGIVLWEIYTYGMQPYCGHSNEEVVNLIRQGILLSCPEGCSPFICSIMAGCWKTEPKNRLTFVEIQRRLVENAPDKEKMIPSQEECGEDNYIVPNFTSVRVD